MCHIYAVSVDTNLRGDVLYLHCVRNKICIFFLKFYTLGMCKYFRKGVVHTCNAVLRDMHILTGYTFTKKDAIHNNLQRG